MARNHLAQRSWLLTFADLAALWRRSADPESDRLEVVAKAAVNNMASGIIILDAQNIVLDLNQQARQIINSVSLKKESHNFTGKPARNALEMWPSLVAYLYSCNKEYQTLLECKSGGEVRYYDVQLETVYEEVPSDRMQPGTDPTLLIGRYIVLHDSTERERASQALQERKKQLRSMVEQLRKADRYQVALADSVQQELKKPLDRLSGIIDSLEQQSEPEQLTQYIHRLKNEAQTMQKLVDEMDVFSQHRRPPSFYADSAPKPTAVQPERKSLRTESFH